MLLAVAPVVASAATPQLVCTPARLGFGAIVVGQSETFLVTLANTGQKSVTVSRISASNSEFTTSQPTLPLVLAAGESVDLSVVFIPTRMGWTGGPIKFSSDATNPNLTLEVGGIGVASEGVTASPSTVAFSQVPVGTKSTLPVVLTNVRAWKITLPAPQTWGGAFSMTGPTFPLTLSAGESVTVNVVFAPQSAGTVGGRLFVPGPALAISLTGTGVVPAAAPGQVSTNPASLSFANVQVGNSQTQSVTLTNSGGSSLTLAQPTVIGSSFTVSGLSNSPANISGANVPLTLNPGQKATLSVQFHPTAAGAVTGQLIITSNSSTISTTAIGLSGTGIGSGSFTYTGSPVITTLVPPNPSTEISSDLFGMTILYATNPQDAANKAAATPFPPFPIYTLRLWGVAYWLTIEPSSGVFNWTALDGTIDLGKQNNVKDFIYTFGLVPKWASSNPSASCNNTWVPAGSCAPPANMSAFDAFATQVVQRYCGVVKYYEPWNEPNNPDFWDGTNAQLMTIDQHVYQIAKDPANCGCTNGVCAPGGGTSPNQVLLPPITGIYVGTEWNQLSWLSSYLASVGTNYPYADIVAFHGYVPLWNKEGIKYQSPEQLASVMPAFKQLLAQYGLSNLPLWNTEGSFEYDSGITSQSQASFVIRYYLLQSALGVSRSIWYAYDLCGWGSLWSSPLCPSNVSPGPVGELTLAGQTYNIVENWLTGANLTHCTQYTNGLWVCELQRSGGYEAWILWSATGTNISVPVPETLGLTVYRDSQNTLNALPPQLTVSEMPMLLESTDCTECFLDSQH